jgi:putative Ca2+/H+ antiporter (TMEM165/GDT1 family)
MNWQPFISTFLLLFVAELGDKTQLAVIMQAAKFQRPWMVLLGAVVALTLVSALGVGIGQLAADYLPRELLRWAAGALFIIMGMLMLLKVI